MSGQNPDTSVDDVMNIINGLSKVAESTKTIEIAKVSAVRPPAHLIEPWEKNFVDGVASVNADGSILNLADIEMAYDIGMNIHLVGPAGCGKTTIARALLDLKNAPGRAVNRLIWARNEEAVKKNPAIKPEDLEPYNELSFPMQHFSCKQGTRSEELTGSIDLRYNDEGQRYVVEVLGALTTAWTKGETFIFEEFDMGSPGVLSEAHLYLDRSSTEAQLNINGPRTIYKDPAFRCIGTSNTRGAGEGAMEFAGTQPLNAAFMSRFTYTVNVSWLPASAEAKLIEMKVGLAGPTVTKMIQVANKIRKAYDEGIVERPISTRALIAWAEVIMAKGKQLGSKLSAMSDREKWKLLVIPAASPTVLNGLSDEASRASIADTLKMM